MDRVAVMNLLRVRPVWMIQMMSKLKGSPDQAMRRTEVPARMTLVGFDRMPILLSQIGRPFCTWAMKCSQGPIYFK